MCEEKRDVVGKRERGRYLNKEKLKDKHLYVDKKDGHADRPVHYSLSVKRNITSSE